MRKKCNHLKHIGIMEFPKRNPSHPTSPLGRTLAYKREKKLGLLGVHVASPHLIGCHRFFISLPAFSSPFWVQANGRGMNLGDDNRQIGKVYRLTMEKKGREASSLTEAPLNDTISAVNAINPNITYYSLQMRIYQGLLS